MRSKCRNYITKRFKYFPRHVRREMLKRELTSSTHECNLRNLERRLRDNNNENAPALWKTFSTLINAKALHDLFGKQKKFNSLLVFVPFFNFHKSSCAFCRRTKEKLSEINLAFALLLLLSFSNVELKGFIVQDLVNYSRRQFIQRRLLKVPMIQSCCLKLFDFELRTEEENLKVLFLLLSASREISE